MFKWKLIAKIEQYLSREYIGRVEMPGRVVFPNNMVQHEDAECFDKDYSTGHEKHAPSARPFEQQEQLTFTQKKLSTGNHIQEKCLCVSNFLQSTQEVEKYIDDSLEKITFAKKLNQYMYEKDLTTAMIYRRCLVDRKLISKITTQEEYHPSKSTVFALCIGLQLSLQEGEEFLSLAGYSFNKSNKYDLIIKFMLENQIYDLDTINEMLIYFKQPCFE